MNFPKNVGNRFCIFLIVFIIICTELSYFGCAASKSQPYDVIFADEYNKNENYTEGVVLMSKRNTNSWAGICRKGFKHSDAFVLCRSMGYKWGMYLNYNQNFSTTQYLNGSNIPKPEYCDFNCEGREDNPVECDNIGICKHGETSECSEPSGIRCYTTEKMEAWLIKLVQVQAHTDYDEGRVIVSMDEGATWGNLCQEDMLTAEASVHCKAAAYHHGLALYGKIAPEASKYHQLPTIGYARNCKGTERNPKKCLDELTVCNSKFDGHKLGLHAETILRCYRTDGSLEWKTKFAKTMQETKSYKEGLMILSPDGGKTWGKLHPREVRSVEQVNEFCSLAGFSWGIITSVHFNKEPEVSNLTYLLKHPICSQKQRAKNINECFESEEVVANEDEILVVRCYKKASTREWKLKLDADPNESSSEEHVSGTVLVSPDGGTSWGRLAMPYGAAIPDGMCPALGFKSGKKVHLESRSDVEKINFLAFIPECKASGDMLAKCKLHSCIHSDSQCTSLNQVDVLCTEKAAMSWGKKWFIVAIVALVLLALLIVAFLAYARWKNNEENYEKNTGGETAIPLRD